MFKVKDLKHPFTWENRQPFVCDRIFYVPDYYSSYEEFSFPGWKDKEIFARQLPVCVEYCSGNGDWIVSKALENKNFNWVAVEKRFDRVRKIWAKIKNYTLDNLFIVCGDALTFTKSYVSSCSIQKVYINFPDPWPKDRHAKHRIIQSEFIHELVRVMVLGGNLMMVTDDREYSMRMIDEVKLNPSLSYAYPYPYYVNNLMNYGSSWFNELWQKKGRDIRYIKCYREA